MRDRLNCCIELEMLTRKGHDRPLLARGRVLLDTDYLANLVCLAAADLVDHAARGAALLVQCMGKLMPIWSPTMMNCACVAQILRATDTIPQTQYLQQEMNNCYWLFHCYLSHCWVTRCDVVSYWPNIQATLFCYELEASMRLLVTIQNIQDEAHRNGKGADQIVSWIKMNLQGLQQ